MPTFAVRNAETLADYITPLKTADAVVMIDTVTEREINGQPGSGHGRFAVYGPGNDGTPVKCAVEITPELLNGEWVYFIHLDDYRPRKDGKAEIEFGKSVRK